jgi:RNA polymerase subunit RPABC4/transcription elongation factor Spt4
MKTVECPSCAMNVEANSETCPICGYDFPKQSKSLMIVVWAMIALILLYLVF